MRKRFFGFTLNTMLFALCLSVEAQQPGKGPRIGFLSNRVKPTPTNPDLFENAFRQGLRDLGYIEGKSVLVEYRYAEGMEERLRGFAAELVQLKVDVLVSAANSGIRAAKQATKTIPIVMMITGDPVALGLIDSLAHPGGNITGLTRLTRDLIGKRLELLKEAIPGVSRIGVLGGLTTDYESAARALKVQILSLEVRGPNPGFKGAFQVATNGRVSALIVDTGGVTISYRKLIADLAIKTRIPSRCVKEVITWRLVA